MKIERMQVSDLKEVMEIEKASFKMPWKRAYFVYDMNRAQAYCMVARGNNRVLGYLIGWKVDDKLHIANIAVQPDERRKGIGGKLLKTILEIGKEIKCKGIFLEVRVSNRIAQNFYRKFGFVHTFTQKQYYHDGEEALILEKEL
ncbi:MAG: ribosomal protein S18-alanine N-acetyltransferase [candidate division WOR-3 bacterium]|nr:ribosomal protein S18-alanine N-acetyltransferase [candidate division WOR-3 bacterium]MDH5684894.1 ribosomal protein S18-alanine N-acetyltransferase [candidate division WOR-3 bacterium]